MTSQRLRYFRTILLACFAVGFVSLGLIAIFDGYIDTPLKLFGRATIGGNPLQFWFVAVFYFALAAVCGYFSVMVAPKRSAT